VPDSQTALCWIAITPDGKFAYAVNTGSAVISGYQVRSNGELSLLGNGVTARPPAALSIMPSPGTAASCTTSLQSV
jgi:6-phosphogluconolactonase (cycloisomerase 2 family)